MTAQNAFISETSAKAARQRIGALIDATETYGWRDDAAANLVCGKPAFWSNCGNSNAPAGHMFEAANRLGGIEAAQADLAAHFTRNGRDVRDECWLDNLLPLNKAAVMDLMRAYQGAGSFRSPEELRRRTERVENPASVMQAAE